MIWLFTLADQMPGPVGLALFLSPLFLGLLLLPLRIPWLNLLTGIAIVGFSVWAHEEMIPPPDSLWRFFPWSYTLVGALNIARGVWLQVRRHSERRIDASPDVRPQEGIPMPMVEFETAVADFLSLGRRLQAIQPVTGERVLAELAAWYRDSRVSGAPVDAHADMLLLQWGGTSPILVPEPTDLRFRGGTKVRYSDQELQYLDFTRQVFAAEDEETEFDDAAVQMSITLAFGPANGDEPDSNLWIHTPDELERSLASFRTVPFVQALLDRPAHVVSITVDSCG